MLVPGRAAAEVSGGRGPGGMEGRLLPEGAGQLECVTGFCLVLLIILFGSVQVLGGRGCLTWAVL